MEHLLPTLQKAKVLNFEMETATLFTLASLYGLRAGSVCAAYAKRCRNEFKSGTGEEIAVEVANEATKSYMTGTPESAERRNTGFFYLYWLFDEKLF
jgi:uridine phosphorylase